MTLPRLGAIVVMLVAAFLTAGCAQEPGDPGRAWTMNLPAGWREADAAALEQLEERRRQAPSGHSFRYTAVFTPGPRDVLVYPYLLVQFTPGAMTQASWQQVFEEVRSTNLVEEGLESTAAALEMRINHDGTVIDAENQRIITTFGMMMGGQQVRTTTITLPGRHGVFHLHFYAPANRAQELAPQFQVMADSFELDEGHGL